VPLSSTVRPGMNFRVAGLGVASVWMNICCLRRRRFKAGALGSVIAFSSELVPVRVKKTRQIKESDGN
jgi:hypothetical protein